MSFSASASERVKILQAQLFPVAKGETRQRTMRGWKKLEKKSADTGEVSDNQDYFRVEMIRRILWPWNQRNSKP